MLVTLLVALVGCLVRITALRGAAAPRALLVAAAISRCGAQVVTTLAGNSTAGFFDATGASAQFNFPYGVAVDASGNVIVADADNHRIRKVTPGGVVTTLAGSTFGFFDATGAMAQLGRPLGVAVDASGNVIVADTISNRIRKLHQAVW